jgi:NADPH oxidase
MNNYTRPSLGFHSAAAYVPSDNLRDHPDLTESSVSGAALQRNRTEGTRLQVQKTVPTSKGPTERKTFEEKLNIWLINEGGNKLFFGVWIFLHLLVASLGFTHFSWKDNLTNARALFGVTYRAQFSLYSGFHST